MADTAGSGVFFAAFNKTTRASTTNDLTTTTAITAITTNEKIIIFSEGSALEVFMNGETSHFFGFAGSVSGSIIK